MKTTTPFAAPVAAPLVVDETRPLLGRSAESASSPQRKRRRRFAVAALAAGSCGLVAATRSLSSAAPPPPTRLDRTDGTHDTVPDDWTCADAEAAGVSPAYCAPPDRTMCRSACVDVDSWCELFCGDACDASVGALCIFDTLANLTATCATVAAHRDAVSVSGDAPPPWAPMAVPDAILYCDYFSWCDLCVGDCPTVVDRPVPPFTAAGAGAVALNGIEAICQDRGLLD
mmetsp:Transcript_5991/g.25061  ORF Transcript_5991/g.25061 Transcript_5991/m.25061 type:complete len:229 (-) Transcript_5991:1126-1812(-)